MAKVNSEGTNTDMMRAHQMKKKQSVPDPLKHVDVDLMVCTDLVDRKKTCALNASSENAGILEVLDANPEDRALVSDVDPQLILKVFFKEKVSITSVVVRFGKAPDP